MAMLHKTSLGMLAIMLFTVVMTLVARPDALMSEQRPAFNLETAVPKQFGDWISVEHYSAEIMDPRTTGALKEIYDQTLSRMYQNSSGYRVMVSIAYGQDQRGGMKLHYPDGCYAAQGFRVNRRTESDVSTPLGSLGVNRIKASLDRRVEPITYWIMIGDKAVLGRFNTRLAEISYGMQGVIPDGLLFRISSIDSKVENAYRLQDQFIGSLAESLSDTALTRLLGLTKP